LTSRRQLRRSRRARKARYRKPRFLNRTRPKGWLAPSLQSRIENIKTWLNKLQRFAPIIAISQELVRFDIQLMQNPDIQGKEYQQGTLAGYETREYLLEKWNRQCAYCEVKDVPLQVEHIHPRANFQNVTSLDLNLLKGFKLEILSRLLSTQVKKLVNILVGSLLELLAVSIFLLRKSWFKVLVIETVFVSIKKTVLATQIERFNAVKTARVASLSGLKPLSFPLTASFYDDYYIIGLLT